MGNTGLQRVFAQDVFKLLVLSRLPLPASSPRAASLLAADLGRENRYTFLLNPISDATPWNCRNPLDAINH